MREQMSLKHSHSIRKRHDGGTHNMKKLQATEELPYKTPALQPDYSGN